MKIHLVWIFILLMGTSGYSQQDSFSLPIRPNGQMPACLIKILNPLENKVKLFKGSNNRDQSILQASAHRELRKMIMNGLILYNDPVSDYLQALLTEFVFPQNDSLSQLNVFAYKSSELNAFVAPQGIILVSIGLLAHLQNEEQVVFVLAHEAQHFFLNHSLEKYKKAKGKFFSEESSPSQNSSLEKVDFNNYKIELEIMADSLALNKLSGLGIGVDSILGLFEILAGIESGLFGKKFPQNILFFTEEADFSRKVGAEDLTLPPMSEDLNIRKESLLKERGGSASSNPINFRTNGEFLSIRELAQKELVFLFNNEKKYLFSINASCHLLVENPKSLFLQKALSQSLYEMGKYRSRGFNALVFEPSLSHFQFIQSLSDIFRKMSPEETLFLVLRHLIKDYQNREDPHTGELIRDLAYDFFSMRPQNLLDPVLDMSEVKENESLKRSLQLIIPLNESFFPKMELLINPEKRKRTDSFIREGARRTLFQDTEVNKKPLAGSLNNSILFLEPSVEINHLGKPRLRTFLREQKGRIRMENAIQKNLKELNMEGKMLSLDIQNSDFHEKFRDYLFFNEWIQGQLRHLPKLGILPQETLDIDSVVSKYGCDFIVRSSVWTETERKKGRFLQGLYLLPLLPPLGVFYLISPESNTYYLKNFLCFDPLVSPQESLFKIRSGARTDFLQSTSYFSLLQIKHNLEFDDGLDSK